MPPSKRDLTHEGYLRYRASRIIERDGLPRSPGALAGSLTSELGDAYEVDELFAVTADVYEAYERKFDAQS